MMDENPEAFDIDRAMEEPFSGCVRWCLHDWMIVVDGGARGADGHDGELGSARVQDWNMARDLVMTMISQHFTTMGASK